MRGLDEITYVLICECCKKSPVAEKPTSAVDSAFLVEKVFNLLKKSANEVSVFAHWKDPLRANAKQEGTHFSDMRLIVTHACETCAHADGCFVSVWTVAEN